MRVQILQSILWPILFLALPYAIFRPSFVSIGSTVLVLFLLGYLEFLKVVHKRRANSSVTEINN